jgi:ubiquinone/menaquinone biosynthesis C-methylase UbiE
MFPIHKARASVFNYDDIPAGYYFQVMAKGSGVQRFWHRKKFEEVAKKIGKSDRLLDIGCGPGSFLFVVGQIKPDVQAVGVDVASRQIEFAIKNVQSQFKQGNISFQKLKSDDVKLPFPDESFDKVTCIEVIEHIHPHLAMKLLEEARRVLKPTGRLTVTTPNYRSLWPLIEFALELLSPVKYHEQHISKFTPNAFAKFLEAAGYEIKNFSTIFIVAPFFMTISPPLARFLHRIERKLPLLLGSLLMAECKISRL